ncbi:hypothetical protein [Massilia endophytica]|uniref:hypothetical protein n=1 Tax=Massilia endophytica TaxID=2899220 RepID=UPI001E363E4A|nr:hypothetical protein [Massilia endophytica]UGQ48095.1 hypothetical protein LSQ66_06405 [Massilia endophytica]
MKSLAGACISLAVAVLAPLPSMAYSDSKAPPPTELIICKGDPIPSGWVIVSQFSYGQAGCRGDINNAWRIKIPGAEEIVCDESPIPAGYAVTGRFSNMSCPGPGKNAKIITRL